MNYILGIDPGLTGGIAFIDQKKSIIKPVSVYKLTPQDIANEIIAKQFSIKMAYLEQVHSSPQQGVKSSFTFGVNYGTYIGILTALKIPFILVRPQVWQKHLRCMSRGDKNVTKRKAQELFPSIKMTHYIADALLIAEYGRQKEGEYAAFDV